MMNLLLEIITASWEVLTEASVYVLFGILVGGLLKVFLNPGSVARHLGHGRFSSVVKAALLGVPMPLCSCGVLPAAAALKKQGASNGATTAFLIATPESGVDSIAITYALIDPIMTVVRPAAAFITAFLAGAAENVFGSKEGPVRAEPDLSCPVDNCCDGLDCPEEEHRNHHGFPEKIRAGFNYALGELWDDLAGWFLIGIILAGIITVMIPDSFMTRYLGGGLSSMLIMLAVGIPLYICATSSTPIAAALILKGVSPGAALVFLLAGPATNVTSLTVLVGILGKRAAAIYLIALSASAVLFGLAVDRLYGLLGVAPQASLGQAAEIIPAWAGISGAVILLAMSVRPVSRRIISRFNPGRSHTCSDDSCHLDETGQTIGPTAAQVRTASPHCPT